MAMVPETSSTLIGALGDPESPRWVEFIERYRPMMEAFLKSRFPAMDPEDAIQETLMVLVRKLPDYQYLPDENGHFRNYLAGILKFKALSIQAKEARRRRVANESAEIPTPQAPSEDEEWRRSVFEVALEQLLADPSVLERTKQIFIRVAVNGEKPEAVAEAFGIQRNAVDQVKARMLARLREIVSGLENMEVLPVRA